MRMMTDMSAVSAGLSRVCRMRETYRPAGRLHGPRRRARDRPRSVCRAGERAAAAPVGRRALTGRRTPPDRTTRRTRACPLAASCSARAELRAAQPHSHTATHRKRTQENEAIRSRELCTSIKLDICGGKRLSCKTMFTGV